MNNLDDDGPRQFIHRGYNLICRPSYFLAVILLLNLWEKPLNIKVNSTGSITFDWDAFKDAVKKQPLLWLLLLALGVISHQKRGNFEIRMKDDQPLVIKRGKESHRIYFTSEGHALLCLGTVFSEEHKRKLYRYDLGGNVICEQFW